MKFRPLKALTHLTEAQRQTLASWFNHHSYPEIAARLAKPFEEGGFATHASVETLRTFYQRLTIREGLASYPESSAYAAEVLAFATRGEVDFPAATVATLEQYTFELAASRDIGKPLETCCRILHQRQRLALQEQTARHTQTHRDRMASVAEKRNEIAEKRAQLAERRLDLAQQRQQFHQAHSARRTPHPTHPSDPSEPSLFSPPSPCASTSVSSSPAEPFEVSDELRPYVDADGQIDLAAMGRDGLEVHDLCRMLETKEQKREREARAQEEAAAALADSPAADRAHEEWIIPDPDPKAVAGPEIVEFDEYGGRIRREPPKPELLGPFWPANRPYPYPADWPPYPNIPPEMPPYRWDNHFKQWWQFPVLPFNSPPYRWDAEQVNWTTRPAPRVGAETRGGPNVPNPYPADWPPYPDLPPEAPPWRWDARLNSWYGYPELPLGSPPYQWNAARQRWEAPLAA